MTWTYDSTFACSGDSADWVIEGGGEHDNTATIVETGQNDDATVTVDCYDLGVTKDAVPTYTRTYEWDIDKSVSPESHILFPGQLGTSTYTVTVNKTGYTDSAWAVTGTINITNPSSLPVELSSVTDSVGGVSAVVVCPSMTVPAGGSLECTYSASLPDANTRTNIATVTLADGGQTYSGSYEVVFGAPTTEVYAGVNVTDTNGESWGPVSGNMTWTYDSTFACCGDTADVVIPGGGSHDNIATICETGDWDNATVTIECIENEWCGLTIGFWKNNIGKYLADKQNGRQVTDDFFEIEYPTPPCDGIDADCTTWGAVYDRLANFNASVAQEKAIAQMIAMKLTSAFSEDGFGYSIDYSRYPSGTECSNILMNASDDYLQGENPMNVGDLWTYVMDLYGTGNFSEAQKIADCINNYKWGCEDYDDNGLYCGDSCVSETLQEEDEEEYFILLTSNNV